MLVAAVRDACSASDRRALLPHRGSLTRAAAGPQADDEEAEADEVAEALRLQKAAAAALAPEDFGLGAGAADGDAASSGGEEDGDERGEDWMQLTGTAVSPGFSQQAGLVKDLQCELLCIRRSDQPAAVQVIFCLGVQQATSQKPGPSPTLQSSTLHAGSLSASLQQTHISRSTSRH